MSKQFIESVMILWRRGLDTREIASRWMCPEAEVWRALVIGREAMRS